MDLLDTVGGYLGVAAVLGMLLLLPLLTSQRRDMHRLRAWMDTEPSHPLADLGTSEGILDRAEAELEALEAQAVIPPSPPSQRTSERWALERVTIERSALEPHPRWRHFVATATQPRVLALIATVSVLVAVAAIFASGRLLETDQPGGRHPGPGAIEPASVEVAVLNGAAIPGLAANVSADVKANGFQLGSVTNSSRPYQQTVVMYEPGQQRAANNVAHDLGVQPVQPIDASTHGIAEGADVVVIAGEDRAGR